MTRLRGATPLAVSGPAPARGEALAVVVVGRLGEQPEAKYYQLTAAGRRQLVAETDNWARISVAIGRALKQT